MGGCCRPERKGHNKIILRQSTFYHDSLDLYISNYFQLFDALAIGVLRETLKQKNDDRDRLLEPEERLFKEMSFHDERKRELLET